MRKSIQKSKIKNQKSKAQVTIQKLVTVSPSQTKNKGAVLAKKIARDKPSRHAIVIALTGELGSGKTTFAQGFAKGLGVKEKILSPTFLVIKKYGIYSSGSTFHDFYHIDCYRLENPKELLELGWKEIISSPSSIVLVEWAEKVKFLLPRKTLWVVFRRKNTLDNHMYRRKIGIESPKLRLLCIKDSYSQY